MLGRDHACTEAWAQLLTSEPGCQRQMQKGQQEYFGQQAGLHVTSRKGGRFTVHGGIVWPTRLARRKQPATGHGLPAASKGSW